MHRICVTNDVQNIIIMAVSFKAILLPHQAKADGTNFVRVRMTHQRRSKYFKTNICISPKDLTKSGKIKSQDALDQIDDLLRRMRRVASEMDMFRLKNMDIEEVYDYIDGQLSEPEEFVLDFVEFGLKVADKKSKGTGDVYRTSMNALLRFFKGRHPDISEITVRNLRKFEEFIRQEPVVKVNWRTGESVQIKKRKGRRAPSQYIGAIRHIYNRAQMEYNDPDLGIFRIANDPFKYYEVPKIPTSIHRDIPVEVIQLMIDTRHELKGRVRMAVDAFLISFGLCGINAIDMYRCEKARKGVIHYFRSKTSERRDDRAEMYTRIEPCIRMIMTDYKDSDRLFDYHRRYSSEGTFTTALNQGLRIWQKRYRQEDFTFYAARHSWGTIGGSKRCNIDDHILAVGMVHSDVGNKMNKIYVRFDWEQLYDANAKILGVFDWK